MKRNEVCEKRCQASDRAGFRFRGKIGGFAEPQFPPENPVGPVAQRHTKDTKDNNMSFNVTVQPSGRSFSVNPDEAMLAAAIRQGIGLPYGCKDGACGSCKCKMLEGTVSHGPHQLKALSHEEEANGFVLTCCGVPESDVRATWCWSHAK
jgi:ferredoxin